MNANRCDDPTNPIIRYTIKHGDITELDYYQAGMTIREQFAMAMAQGLLASGLHDANEHGVAQEAVLNADALLAELERTK